MIEIIKKSDNLRYLDLTKFPELDDEKMQKIFESNPNMFSKLENLIIRANRSLTPLTLVNLSKYCKNLKFLDVKWNNKIIDKNSSSLISQNCPLIEYLSIGWNNKVVDDSVLNQFLPLNIV